MFALRCSPWRPRPSPSGRTLASLWSPSLRLPSLLSLLRLAHRSGSASCAPRRRRRVRASLWFHACALLTRIAGQALVQTSLLRRLQLHAALRLSHPHRPSPHRVRHRAQRSMLFPSPRPSQSLLSPNPSLRLSLFQLLESLQCRPCAWPFTTRSRCKRTSNHSHRLCRPSQLPRQAHWRLFLLLELALRSRSKARQHPDAQVCPCPRYHQKQHR